MTVNISCISLKTEDREKGVRTGYNKYQIITFGECGRMTAVFPHKNNTSMNKSNTLYWKTATEPAERIEVRLVLNSYIDNNNLYVGLESRSKENPECWESYTDITVNLNSLPPFHAYVDNRDCNRHVHDFLTNNRIAEPAGFEYQGFRMFRFNPDRLKELAPEQFKTISAKLPPQDDMIKDIIYQERHFPLRTVQDIHGIYLVSSKELEESLIEGVRNLDAAANELLDGICLFCSTQELRYLTDAELIETIYAQ